MDGGFVVAAWTNSFGEGDTDFLVLKLDELGNVEWQKTYGGFEREVPYSIRQTSDGGFIVGGWTRTFGPSGEYFWILKLGQFGNIEWQKTYGSLSSNWLSSIQETFSSDGTPDGYIVAGYGAGGGLWILKLNQDGNVTWSGGYYEGTWQKTYSDGLSHGLAQSIQQTKDGGYIVAGRTADFIGDNFDFWVLKLLANGDVDWQYTYDGNNWEEAFSVQQTFLPNGTPDGYVVAGNTDTFGNGSMDIWVLKLNSGGGIQWQKTYGSASVDTVSSIDQTTDGGFVMSGWTNSFGDGSGEAWVLKLDSKGRVGPTADGITWQKTYGGSGLDNAYYVQQTTDGGFVVAGRNGSLRPGADIWVLKLGAKGEIDSSCTFISDTSETGVGTTVSPALTLAAGVDSTVEPVDTIVDAHFSNIESNEQCTGIDIPLLAYSANTITDCGNGDGFVDPGEEIDINITVQNIGSEGAYNANGVLSTVTTGVNVTVATAAFPDISAGDLGTSPTPFEFDVETGVPCGMLIGFTLDLTYEDGWGNSLSKTASFHVPVGVSGELLLSEQFDAGLPAMWTVENGGNNTNCGDACTWSDADPCDRDPVIDNLESTYMIVDSMCAGVAIMDEVLITPQINANAASAVTLQFDHKFLGFPGDLQNDDFATVMVRSAQTLGFWDELIKWDENGSNSGTIFLDATLQCAGYADCQFGFRYESFVDWYWGIDNVFVAGTGGCNPATCP
jgi:hypothetical protein